ncbi:Hypothetical protein NAEGRDRAFT_71669 [Naegleria gruberi]|uniref:F-box domain-containing protein n=1 Tax=Naegleria gruberi TaxID=5762 RepID=D2VRQ6_NAEGR|nr:uncharacterized protein NAEGRDRAFT_71669 [Naegleria gruberi]EFC40432.1 Hypothetical protein NAEGRDRAFT_71669 [Naegleria gruberi]|eukprot:XP_002673176.1 Hypothetical protein NAEGRDRAFT_71669 [Naegleria gruberi strain NEG-M]
MLNRVPFSNYFAASDFESESSESNNSPSIFPFLSLPSELKANILSFLPSNEIINFGSLSRSSYELVAPFLSDSIAHLYEDYADEYSIDIWTELINRVAITRREKIGSLKDCKNLFLKLFLEQRSCRMCSKTTPSFQSFLSRKIVKSCYCDGFICRKPCWNKERLADESVSRCSKCGYVYQFSNPEKIGMIPKVFSRYPISSQFILTALSSISCILFVYSLVSSLGYIMPHNSQSELWLELENFWIFKYFPFWNYFVNGMSVISFIIFVLLIIASIFSGNVNVGANDLGAMEGIILIITVLIVVATPFLLGSYVKKAVLEKSIYGCPVKAPRKHDLDRDDHHRHH